MECRRLSSLELVLRAHKEVAMEDYIHRENMALLRRRLSETSGESQRQVLLKLLAEEEAKDRTVGNSKSAEQQQIGRMDDPLSPGARSSLI